MSGNNRPKLLASLSKPQVVHVAAVCYETPLSISPPATESLANIVRQNLACDNVGCTPGPCNPAKHLFAVGQYLVTAGGNATTITLNELADTSQRDSISSLNGEDDDLNPQADLLQQRRELIISTLAKEGIQLSDVSELLGSGRPKPTPRSTVSTPSGAGSGRRDPPLPPPNQSESSRQLFNDPVNRQVLQDQPGQEGTLAQMMSILRQNADDRATELRLREAQMESQSRLLDLITRRMDEADSAPVAGRVELVEPRNTAALQMAGVALTAQYSVIRNTANMDLSKSKYKLKSGSAPQTQQTPRVAEVWPHYYLDPLLFEMEVLHENLTFSQWCMGMVTKIFSEFDPDRNLSPEHNMLHVFMLIVRLAETHPWPDIRKLDESLFLALERGNLKWNDWAGLETWFSRAETTLRSSLSSSSSWPPSDPSRATATSRPPKSRRSLTWRA